MSGAVNNQPGYRLAPAGGPSLRTDIVDVYVFRRDEHGAISFLQLRRAAEPLAETWHPIMGHVETSETAIQCAARELSEEVGLVVESDVVLGAWALEQVHPYFVAEIDVIVLGPRFAVEVAFDWSPTLNEEHSEARWVEEGEARSRFLWPGQRAAAAEIHSVIVPGGETAEHLRISWRQSSV